MSADSTADELVGDPDAGFTDVTADDTIEEMVDKGRVRQIYQQRERIKNAFQRGPAMRLQSNAYSRDQVTYAIDQAVREYVDDLRPIMVKAAETEKTEHNYWNGNEFPVSATITPPQEIRGVDADRYRSPGDQAWRDEPTGLTIEGSGASAIFRVDGYMTLRWEYEVDHRYKPSNVEAVRVTRALPRDYLRQVRNICNDFLQTVDLDVSIGGGTRDVEAEVPSR